VSVDDFFTRLNPVLRAILLSPLHPLLSRGLLLLTFTGRKTGKRFTIPVGYQSEEVGVLTVMASEAPKKQWWKNYREPGPVEVRLRGRTRTGTARLLDPTSAEFRDCAVRTLLRVPAMGRIWGIDYDREAGLTEAQATTLASDIAAVRIQLDPALPGGVQSDPALSGGAPRDPGLR
jgi:deazaflavin-dependent oxidoreductase (nitroreductase family)